MAWDINRDTLPKIAVCVPHTGTVNMEWAHNTWGPLIFTKSTWCIKHPFLCRGPPIDIAREDVTAQALEWGADYIFYVDSDIIAEVPGNINELLYRLYKRDLPIVSGLYRTKKIGNPWAMWTFKDKETGFRNIRKWTADLVEVDVTGLGCCLVKTEVFDNIERPWFRWDIKHAPCIPPGHSLLMGNNIEDVATGHKIIDGNGFLSHVQHNYSFNYDGNIIRITPSIMKIPIETTPNHRILTLQDFTPVWLRAGRLTKGDFISSPILASNDINRVSLYSPLLRKEGDKLFFRSRRSTINTELEISNDLMYLLGLYAAKGSSEPKRGRIRFSFGISEKEQQLANTTSNIILDTLSLEPSINYRDHSTTVVIHNKPLSIVFSNWFNTDASNKKLPGWILTGSKIMAEQTYKGLWHGDGHLAYTGDGYPELVVTTASRNLAIQSFSLLLKMGYMPRISVYKQSSGAFGAGNDIYRTKLCKNSYMLSNLLGIDIKPKNTKWERSIPFIYDNKYWFRINNIDIIPYSGKVYDLNVPSSGSYVLNGITVHNSEDFYFLLKAKAEGKYKVIVDTTIKCSHIGTFKILPGIIPAFRPPQI